MQPCPLCHYPAAFVEHAGPPRNALYQETLTAAMERLRAAWTAVEGRDGTVTVAALLAEFERPRLRTR